MKFGVCGDWAMAETAKAVGYDYVEMTVAARLKPLEDQAAFETELSAGAGAGISVPALNGFVPGSHRITGPEASLEQLTAYVQTTMERAERAGVGMIVFGSGGARQIPDGVEKSIALEQIREFLRMAGPIAAEHRVAIAIEPLNRAECNVLNTVDECAQMTRELDHPAVRLLVDAYHMLRDDDLWRSIVQHGDILTHAHVATKESRLAPGAEDCDLQPFFDALGEAGYTGGVSIEGRISDPDGDLPRALDLMREWAGQ